MQAAILQNIEMISWFLIILGLGFASNIASAIYLNVFTDNQKWDTKRFLMGIIKAIIFCLSFYVFTIGATIIPSIMGEYGIITEEISEVINLTMVNGLLITVSIAEYKKTIDNWRKTLKINNGN